MDERSVIINRQQNEYTDYSFALCIVARRNRPGTCYEIALIFVSTVQIIKKKIYIYMYIYMYIIVKRTRIFYSQIFKPPLTNAEFKRSSSHF